MNIGIATQHARSYMVATPVYEGPLDLLLHLIERAELDITKLALAQVTDQYLEHLRGISDRSTSSAQAPEEVSAFLVIAAKLLQIKSEVLLPRPALREEGEEDPGEALTRQLVAYKRFKDIANFLSQREEAGFRTYLRLAPPPKVDHNFDLSGFSLAEILAAAQSVFEQTEIHQPLGTVVIPPRVTIREKIALIARFLRLHGKSSFHALLESRASQLDIVVTFLAMLELIKRRWVRVHQEILFGEIFLEPSEIWDETEPFELEFGE